MRAAVLTGSLVLLNSVAFGQQAMSAPAFDVVSVKPSAHLAGPDYNNRLAFDGAGITAKNVTLRRLVAEAYGVQLRQVSGPDWLDRNEYDLEAKKGSPVGRDQLAPMLQTVLAERFGLKAHRETRQLRVYELVIDKGQAKIHATNEGEKPRVEPGLHFHGDLRQFADFLAVQLSIPVSDDPTQPGRATGVPMPVLDRTGLLGTYDFGVDIKPEPGSDMFVLWQRALQDTLGLRLDVRRGGLDVVVIDSAEKTPVSN